MFGRLFGCYLRVCLLCALVVVCGSSGFGLGFACLLGLLLFAGLRVGFMVVCERVCLLLRL